MVWRMKYRRLKRRVKLSFYGKIDKFTHIMEPFQTAVSELQPGEKLLVVAACPSTAKAYAEFCLNRGISCREYDGDS